jgi:ribosomal protein S3AE
LYAKFKGVEVIKAPASLKDMALQSEKLISDRLCAELKTDKHPIYPLND